MSLHELIGLLVLLMFVGLLEATHVIVTARKVKR